jgi:hypothetical protein
LLVVGFGFLKTKNVGVHQTHIINKVFFGDGPNAINIEGDQFHEANIDCEI